jgi:hypothetical protein
MTYLRAIVTVFVPATNAHGSRVRAKAHDQKSVTVSWSHIMDADGNHEAAARKLAERAGWFEGKHRDLVGGNTLPDGKSRVWLLKSG